MNRPAHDPAFTICEAGVLVECCHWSELTPDRDSASAAFREHIAEAYDPQPLTSGPASVRGRLSGLGVPHIVVTGVAVWAALLLELVR